MADIPSHPLTMTRDEFIRGVKGYFRTAARQGIQVTRITLTLAILALLGYHNSAQASILLGSTYNVVGGMITTAIAAAGLCGDIFFYSTTAALRTIGVVENWLQTVAWNTCSSLAHHVTNNPTEAAAVVAAATGFGLGYSTRPELQRVAREVAEATTDEEERLDLGRGFDNMLTALYGLLVARGLLQTPAPLLLTDAPPPSPEQDREVINVIDVIEDAAVNADRSMTDEDLLAITEGLSAISRMAASITEGLGEMNQELAVNPGTKRRLDEMLERLDDSLSDSSRDNTPVNSQDSQERPLQRRRVNETDDKEEEGEGEEGQGDAGGSRRRRRRQKRRTHKRKRSPKSKRHHKKKGKRSRRHRKTRR